MHMYMPITIEVGRPSSVMYLPLLWLRALLFVQLVAQFLMSFQHIYLLSTFHFAVYNSKKSAVGSYSSPLAVVE